MNRPDLVKKLTNDAVDFLERKLDLDLLRRARWCEYVDNLLVQSLEVRLTSVEDALDFDLNEREGDLRDLIIVEATIHGDSLEASRVMGSLETALHSWALKRRADEGNPVLDDDVPDFLDLHERGRSMTGSNGVFTGKTWILAGPEPRNPWPTQREAERMDFAEEFAKVVREICAPPASKLALLQFESELERQRRLMG